jgi:small subunit ribosomal protein S1
MVLDIDVDNRRLSLGHKQLEENPWDVFETVFSVGSIHSGTIVNINDKGAIVALPYGVEGFAPLRHLTKEDGSHAKEEDVLDFKVIEFSKDNKKIILSHTKVYQDAAGGEKRSESEEKKKTKDSSKKSVKKIKDNLEKTTLGDIESLANLKSDMVKAEEEEKQARKVAAKATEHKTKEPKSEEPKSEEPKSEEPKSEEPNAEESEAEESNTEESEAEEPNTEKSEAEEPNTEKSEAEEPNTEKSEAEEPNTEESETEEPKQE